MLLLLIPPVAVVRARNGPYSGPVPPTYGYDATSAVLQRPAWAKPRRDAAAASAFGDAQPECDVPIYSLTAWKRAHGRDFPDHPCIFAADASTATRGFAAFPDMDRFLALFGNETVEALPGYAQAGGQYCAINVGCRVKNKSDALGPRVAMDRRVSGVLRVSIWLWAAVRARSSLPRRARALRRCAAEDDEPTCRPGADGPAVPLPPADVAGAQLRAEGVVSRAAGSNVGRPRARRRAADLARRRLRRGNAGGSAGPTAAPVRPIPRRDYMAARELVARDAQSRRVRSVRPEVAPSRAGAPCSYS